MSIPFLAMNTCTADAAETEGQKKEGYMFDDWTRLYRIGERGSSNGRSIDIAGLNGFTTRLISQRHRRPRTAIALGMLSLNDFVLDFTCAQCQRLSGLVRRNVCATNRRIRYRLDSRSDLAANVRSRPPSTRTREVARWDVVEDCRFEYLFSLGDSGVSGLFSGADDL